MKNANLFQKLSLWTIIAVYFLVFVGGFVRATGAGMGCPDWPKCFGSWIPPTSASQLPPNYKETFGAKLKGEVIFNPLKTWIEYVNRLVGVSIGILIFSTLLASIPYLKKDKVVFYCSLASFIVVAIEGWLGSRVVSMELKPTIVTAHFILSIVLIFILLYTIVRAYGRCLDIEKLRNVKTLNYLLLISICATLIQIILGTTVRQSVDEVNSVLGEAGRASWIDNLGRSFYIHRSFSWIILILNASYIYFLFKNTVDRGILSKLSSGLLLGIIAEGLLGLILAYFAMPAYAQPIHMTLALIIIGIQFIMLLLINKEIVFKEALLRNPEIVR